MWLEFIGLILSFIIILASCELFTNGIEWLGRRLKVGDGVTGSIFSAVGTCLPETTVPIVAILFSEDAKSSIEIGVGAIIGAPFMLSTLAFFVTGFSVLIFSRKRKAGMRMHVSSKILKRDLSFFIAVYSLGVGVSFTHGVILRYMVAVFLIFNYIYYVYLTAKNDKRGNSSLDLLYFSRYLGLRPRFRIILLQTAVSLLGIVFGAELFVENIKSIADIFKISPLVLSLVITPVVTELPEKFNSILWISKKKDTLALGNITGAMVFQSCIPVSIGIFATPWQLDIKAVVSAALAVSSGLATYLWIKIRGRINPVPLLMGGLFYAAFICFLVSFGFR